MKAFLKTDELSLNLGSFRLGPLSMTLAKRDYLVLLGPSGCGKTSLLKAIAGFYRLPPRTLWLNECDIGIMSPDKRCVGYVAQSIDLFPHMNVAKNVAFGLRYQKNTSGEKRMALDRIIDLLGLSDLTHRVPNTLSGGESRRVSLARSLVLNPHVLLLDEPLSMLDHNARAEMLNILKTIHHELGTATVHVTHDREEAWNIGDRCAVMRNGKIEQTGTVAELFRKPAFRHVAEFLGGSNVFRADFIYEGNQRKAILDWFRFDLDAPVSLESGYIYIRPETLKISANPGRKNTIKAKICSIVDRGIYTELRAEAENGPILTAHLAGAECSKLMPGHSVFLECRAEPHYMQT